MAPPSTSSVTPTTPTLSAAVAVRVTAVPFTVAPAAGAVTETVGGVTSLLTWTDTGAEVVELPAPSRATAASACTPLATPIVLQLTLYGLAVSSAPIVVVPSSTNRTPTTAMLSAAVAVSETAAPATIAPLAGAVIDTVGGVPSRLATVTVTITAVVVLPAASRA